MALNVLISSFFRLVLIGYGALIIISHPNVFSIWVYIFVALAYVIVFVFLKRRNIELYSALRLINDYSFIVVILYGKAPSFFNHCFILLPIINSSNYSGRYGFLSSLRLYFIAIAAMFVFYGFRFDKTWIAPLVAFWTLSLVSKGRELARNLQLLLSNPVSQVNINQLPYNTSNKRKILNDIIAEFNNNSILKLFKFQVKSVLCFRLNEKGASLISSSSLVKKFIIDGIEGIDSASYVFDEDFSGLKISINDIEKKQNMGLFIGARKVSSTYLYYIEFVDSSLPFLLQYVKKIFLFTFDNLSKFYEIENSLKQRRQQLVKDLKQQALYIEKSTNNIHFINNKLSPILEYFTLRGDIQSGVVKANAKIAQVFNDLETRSKRNIQMIATRSTKQLDKQLNPFYNRNPELISADQLWSSISSAWLESGLSADDIFLLNDDEVLLSKHVFLQLDYFEIIVDEIIVNILKYGQLKQRCIFSMEENYILLIFVNNIEKNQIEKLKILAAQFNGDQVTEMLKRTSHGMAMMKSYLIHLGVSSNIDFEDEEYNLVLRINFK